MNEFLDPLHLTLLIVGFLLGHTYGRHVVPPVVDRLADWLAPRHERR